MLNCNNLTQRQALKVGCENIWNLPRHLSTYSKYMFYRKVHTYIIHIYIYIYTLVAHMHMLWHISIAHAGARLTTNGWSPKVEVSKKNDVPFQRQGFPFLPLPCAFLSFCLGGEGGVGDKCKPSYSHVPGPFFWKSTMVVKAFGCETCMTLRRNYCRFYWKRYQIEGCQYVYRSSSWNSMWTNRCFGPLGDADFSWSFFSSR